MGVDIPASRSFDSYHRGVWASTWRKADSAGTIAALTDLRSEPEIRSSGNRVDRLVADSGGGDIQGSAPAKSKRFDDLFTRTTFAYHLKSSISISLSYLFSRTLRPTDEIFCTDACLSAAITLSSEQCSCRSPAAPPLMNGLVRRASADLRAGALFVDLGLIHGRDSQIEF
jgi:hypothetical protein